MAKVVTLGSNVPQVASPQGFFPSSERALDRNFLTSNSGNQTWPARVSSVMRNTCIVLAVAGIVAGAQQAHATPVATSTNTIQVNEITSFYVTYTLQVELANTADSAQPVDALVKMPFGSAVVAANASSATATYKATLLESNQANTLFASFQGQPNQKTAGNSVVVVRDFADDIAVESVQVSANSSIWVTLKVIATPCHASGRWFVPLATAGGTPVLGPDSRFTVPANLPEACASGDLTISGPFVPTEPISTQLGRVSVGRSQGASMLRMDIGPALMAFVEATPVVFVIDRSRSISEIQLNQQFTAIADYVQRSKVGRYQLIVFDRHATALLPTFATAQELLAQLARLRQTLVRANGSNVDEALDLAAHWLDQKSGRVLVFTDGELRQSLTTDELRNASARIKISPVHAIELDTDEANVALGIEPFEPEAGGDFDTIVGASGGLSAQLTRAAGARYADLAVLIAPQVLEGITVDDEPLEDLPLGAGRVSLWPMPRRPQITMRGRLWSMPWQRTVAAESNLRATTAAFAATQLFDLSPVVVRKLAMIGGAVSSQTSYLLQPRTPAYSATMTARGHGFMSHTPLHEPTSRVSSCGVAPPSLRLNETMLTAAVEQCRRTQAAILGDAPTKLAFEMEIHGGEILDITDAGTNHPSALASCLREGFWQVEIAPDARTSNTHVEVSLTTTAAKITTRRAAER